MTIFREINVNTLEDEDHRMFLRLQAAEALGIGNLLIFAQSLGFSNYGDLVKAHSNDESGKFNRALKALNSPHSQTILKIIQINGGLK